MVSQPALDTRARAMQAGEGVVALDELVLALAELPFGPLLLSSDEGLRQTTASILKTSIDKALGVGSGEASAERRHILTRLLFKCFLVQLPSCFSHRDTAECFFDTLSCVLDSAGRLGIDLFDSPESGLMPLTLWELLDCLCLLVTASPVFEAKGGPPAPVQDTALAGLFKLLGGIVSYVSRIGMHENLREELIRRIGLTNNIMEHVFHCCLYPSNDGSAPSPSGPQLELLSRATQAAGRRRDEASPEDTDESIAVLILIDFFHFVRVAAPQEPVETPPLDVAHWCLSACRKQQLQNLPKCKSVETRTEAVKLWLMLSAGSDECRRAAGRMAVSASAEYIFDSHEPAASQYSPVGYQWGLAGDVGCTGITNPASICHLSAFVQQLAAMREVVDTVMGLELDGIEGGSCGNDVALVRELKMVFARMMYTHSGAIEIEGLLGLMRCSSGEPISATDQHDVVETGIQLVSAVERVAKLVADSERGSLHRVLAGSLVHEVRGDLPAAAKLVDGYSPREDDLIFTKTERFYFLSAPVSLQVRDLYSSLSMVYSAVSSFEFDWTERLKALPSAACAVLKNRLRIPTSKRTKLHDLPLHLLVHLQRYGFDHVNMKQRKLQSRFEFPDTLDVRSSYVWDASSDSHYHLSGVVVHSGSAESGHYCSYVRKAAPLRGATPQHCPRRLVQLVRRHCGTAPSTSSLASLSKYLTSKSLPLDTTEESPAIQSMSDTIALLRAFLQRPSGAGQALSHIWLKLNDEKVDRIDRQDMVDAAFGDDAADIEAEALLSAKKKRHKKKTRPVSSDAPETAGCAMVLAYSRGLEAARTPLYSLKTLVDSENKEYWKRRSVESLSSPSLLYVLDALAESHPSGIHVHWQCFLQRVDLLMLYHFFIICSRCSEGILGVPEAQCAAALYRHIYSVGGPLARLTGGGFRVLPGVGHWLLRHISRSRRLLSGNSLDSWNEYLKHCEETRGILLKVLRHSMSDALTVHPFPRTKHFVSTCESPSDDYQFDDFGSAAEICANGGAILHLFADPFSLMSDLLFLSESRGTTISPFLDIMRLFASQSESVKSWLVSRGMLSIVMFHFVSSDLENLHHRDAIWSRSAVLMDSTQSAVESRQLLHLLQLLLKPTIVVPLTALEGWGESNEDIEDEGSEHRLTHVSFETLSECEKSVLQHRTFLAKLLLSMDCYSSRCAVGHVVACIVFSSKSRSQVVLGAFEAAFCELCHGSTMEEAALKRRTKALFRIIFVLSQIEDELLEWRLEVAWTMLLALLQSCEHDVVRKVCILLLPRACKVPKAMNWLSQNTDAVDLLGLSIENLRRGDHEVMSSWNTVQSLLDRSGCSGSAQEGYDSDDEPSTLLHRRVEVIWTGDKRYAGTVVSYSAELDEHQVLYDDGDVRSYSLTRADVARSVQWTLL